MELLVIEQENTMEIFTNPLGLDPYIEKVRSEVKTHIPDTTTDKGRKAIASLAAGVAKSKTYLDGIGKELVSDWKSKAKLVDNSRKTMRDELDALKIEARKPLTEWEVEEQERIDLAAEKLKQEADHSDALNDNELFDLRAEKAAREAEEQARLNTEQEKARKLQAQKEQKERDKSIAKAAAEESDRKAKQAEQDKINAQNRADQAEQELENRRLQAIEDKKQAEINARHRERQATQAEEQRQLNIKAAELAEQEKREKNKRHIGSIRKAAKIALMDICNLDEKKAKEIVMAISRNDIPNITINY